jgi:hypothetical protein
VSELQLRLFPETKPLLERFGVEFFRAIPKRPGVYLMSDERGRVLYIGKAGNLRQRLSSYKYPGKSSKAARLGGRVRSITWEICDDGFMATMRENELLRLYKPVFNVLNTRSEHYPFIGLRREGAELLLRLTKSNEARHDEQLFGAFKGLPLVRAGFAALLRFLWLMEHASASLFELPLLLLNPKPPERWLLGPDLAAGIHPLLTGFFSGHSDMLTPYFREALPKEMSPFERSFHAHDLEILTEFFARGPQRNAQLRNIFHMAGPCILQSELDDLLVLREQYSKPIASSPTVG